MYKKIFTLLFPIAIGATQVSAQTTFPADRYEPNNGPKQAERNAKIGNPATITATINAAGDEDWYYLPATQEITAELYNVPEGCNLDLQFYTTDKKLILTSANKYSNSERLSALLLYKDLYVRVYHADKDYTGQYPYSSKKYSLRFSRKYDEKIGIVIYDSSPVGQATSSVSAAPSSSIKKVEKEAILFVYPTPAKEVINFDFITSAAGERTATITDLNGSVVVTQKVAVQEGPNTVSLALTGLKAGLYNLNVTGLASVKFQVAE